MYSEICRNNLSRLKLSIIIVNFNTCDITRQCLESIYNAEWRDNFEIIVIDNNSQDGSVDMIAKEFPEVRLIANKDNKLFAIANNQGAEIAKGKYLLLLNSDTIVEKDNLQKMIDFFETQPDDVICIGPKILNPDRTLQSCGNFQWEKSSSNMCSSMDSTNCFRCTEYGLYWIDVLTSRTVPAGSQVAA